MSPRAATWGLCDVQLRALVVLSGLTGAAAPRQGLECQVCKTAKQWELSVHRAAETRERLKAKAEDEKMQVWQSL